MPLALQIVIDSASCVCGLLVAAQWLLMLALFSNAGTHTMAAVHYTFGQCQYQCTRARSLGLQRRQLCILHRDKSQSVHRLLAVEQHKSCCSEAAAAPCSASHSVAGPGCGTNRLVSSRSGLQPDHNEWHCIEWLCSADINAVWLCPLCALCCVKRVVQTSCDNLHFVVNGQVRSTPLVAIFSGLQQLTMLVN